MTAAEQREAMQAELRGLVQREKPLMFTEPDAVWATDEKTLGIMVSEFAHWDAERIAEVSAEAFSNANFPVSSHDLVAFVLGEETS